MHIADGVLPTPVLIGGYVVTCSIIVYTTRKMPPEDIPKTAVMSACFFVASLIHIPIGTTSVHLILNGLVGIILGRLAFCAIFIGVILQTLLFQHGGITTIGTNTVMMGFSALLSYKIFDLLKPILRVAIAGAIAGASGILVGTIFLSIFLISAGKQFLTITKLALFAYIPVTLIEGIIASFVSSLIEKVKPEMLERK